MVGFCTGLFGLLGDVFGTVVFGTGVVPGAGLCVGDPVGAGVVGEVWPGIVCAATTPDRPIAAIKIMSFFITGFCLDD